MIYSICLHSIIKQDSIPFKNILENDNKRHFQINETENFSLGDLPYNKSLKGVLQAEGKLSQLEINEGSTCG